jgi:hypothetical protein
VPSSLARSPAAVEFDEDRNELERATEAIMHELANGPRPAEELLNQVVDGHHLDLAVAQKALIAAVRRGDLVMDQRFTVHVV